MSLLKVLTIPDKLLRTKCEPVKVINDDIHTLILDMIETMYVKGGIGLAAPQVGVLKQIIIVCPSRVQGEEAIFINPEIIKKTGHNMRAEGCLSIPGLTKQVRRSEEITVKYTTPGNVDRIIEANGWLARVIQHEIDHLKGILFIDRK